MIRAAVLERSAPRSIRPTGVATGTPALGRLGLFRSRMTGARLKLLADAQLSDDIEITLRVFTPHVIEKTSATAHQAQQTTP